MSDSLPSPGLTGVAETFTQALAPYCSPAVADRLRGEPARTAVAHALVEAVAPYSEPERLALAGPLLRANSVLAQPDVVAELAELVRFERPPRADVLATHWAAALDEVPDDADLVADASALVEAIGRRLAATAEFGPVFDARSLDALAAGASGAGSPALEDERRLARLGALLDTPFGELVRAFARAPKAVRNEVRDASGLIAEKTDGYVGRRAVFQAIDRFMAANHRGYFFIRGDPGIGKSAFMAQLARTRGHVHHFNVRAEGIDRAEQFQRNICAQLIARYELPYASVPAAATTDADFLKRLLEEVSDSLSSEERAVVLVDGLDEVADADASVGINLLCLPLTLPSSVYIVGTTRFKALRLRIECEQATLTLDPSSEENRADVRQYLRNRGEEPALRAYLERAGLALDAWVEAVLEKSEGNFIYLRHVLPELSAGQYAGVEVSALPAGLAAYYRDHWEWMKAARGRAWSEEGLPVIAALTAARKPITIKQIARFAGIEQPARVRAVLDDWREFLHEVTIDVGGRPEHAYRLYHASFARFIVEMDEVADEQVNLRDARDRIADEYLGALFS